MFISRQKLMQEKIGKVFFSADYFSISVIKIDGIIGREN